MLELRILTGLHRGAALPLEGDRVCIGSGEENDIVLLDPGMPVRAAILERATGSSWTCRMYASPQKQGESPSGAPARNDIEIGAGARWFAGPVLMACEEETAPWSNSAGEQRAPSAQPRFSLKAKLAVALVVATLIVALAATLGGQAASRLGIGEPARHASSVLAAPSADRALRLEPAATAAATPASGVRLLAAAVYPNETKERPPFSIGSANGGPYGFIVTDDGRVLLPGSRWRGFTLVRIEPGRAIFTGPFAAELTW